MVPRTTQAPARQAVQPLAAAAPGCLRSSGGSTAGFFRTAPPDAAPKSLLMCCSFPICTARAKRFQGLHFQARIKKKRTRGRPQQLARTTTQLLARTSSVSLHNASKIHVHKVLPYPTQELAKLLLCMPQFISFIPLIPCIRLYTFLRFAVQPFHGQIFLRTPRVGFLHVCLVKI